MGDHMAVVDLIETRDVASRSRKKSGGRVMWTAKLDTKDDAIRDL